MQTILIYSLLFQSSNLFIQDHTFHLIKININSINNVQQACKSLMLNNCLFYVKAWLMNVLVSLLLLH